MSYDEVMFYVIATFTVLGALGVVMLRNVVHAAVAFIVSLVGVAGVFLLLSVEFLALVQILIYAAAVSVLILFALMLTRARDIPHSINGPQWPFGALAAVLLFIALIMGLARVEWNAPDMPALIPFEQLGETLFRNWAVPFEVASLVLLVALVGAIILARTEEGE